jgi:hypothetical protein
MAAGATLTTGKQALGRGFCLTERDLELLRFVAQHRFVLAAQVEVWLGAHEVIAYRRLGGLVRSGLLVYERLFHNRPGCYRISGAGLALAESDLPRPVIDLRCYRHDVGVVWLWLAAAGDRRTPVDVFSERRMRSHDESPDNGPNRFAIPLGGYAPSGRPRVHYPDVLFVRRDGSRVAFELELTLKSRSRLEAILAGYSRLVYLTDRLKVARAIEELGVLFGLDGRLSAHYLDGANRNPDRWVWNMLRAGEVRW